MKNKTRKTGYILLFLIISVLFIAGFVFLSWNRKLADLQAEIGTKTERWNALQEIRDRNEALEQKLADIRAQIARDSETVYISLNQEEALKILNRMGKKADVVYDIMDFVEYSDLQTGMRYIDVRISFTASYSRVMKLIETIQNNEKRMVIKYASLELSEYGDYSLDATSDADRTQVDRLEEIMVNMTVAFPIFPELEGLKKDEIGMRPSSIRRSDDESLFRRFVPGVDGDGVASGEGGDPIEWFPPGFILQFDFENPDLLTVRGNDCVKELKTSQSNLSKSGSYSTAFYFDFGRQTGAENKAAVDILLKEPINMEEMPRDLTVYVYSYDFSPCRIGAVMKSSEGEEYRCAFSETIHWIGWNALRAELPSEMLSSESEWKLEGFYIEAVLPASAILLFDTLLAGHELK